MNISWILTGRNICIHWRMKTYYFRLFFGGKVLKYHSFSLNTENNLIPIRDFFFFFAYFICFRYSWKKTTWKSTRILRTKNFMLWDIFLFFFRSCCKTYFFLYLLANTRNFCSLTWLTYEKCLLMKYILRMYKSISR